VTLRDRLGELCRALPLTVLLAAMSAVVWAAVSRRHTSEIWPFVLTSFFQIVGVCWAILIPAKFWTDRRGDGWTRRLVMMVVGGLVGLWALWLSGWSPGQPPPPSLTGDDGHGAVVNALAPATVVSEASYLSYFALVFFALRWWRMTDRRRPQRFSFAPVLAAGFWGALLLLLAHPSFSWHGAILMACSAVVVQLVSPWEPLPAPPAKKMRLRYA
jgi:hypothetical protein